MAVLEHGKNVFNMRTFLRGPGLNSCIPEGQGKHLRLTF
uniref:Uncharacterized protein n=1 Tax=Anguilla anguilla TaxID=7936 RepID=A0A0E9S0M0_ANGAN